jgi:4'-phosphopantetheinyl transferase
MTAVEWTLSPVTSFPAETIAVWRVPMKIDQPLRDDEWGSLSADERARAERFKFDAPRIRLVRCRRALRFILSQWLDVAPSSLIFEYGEHGKPELISPCGIPSFNVSHSHDWAMVAVTATGQLGVDVERCDPRMTWPGLARRFFSAREVNDLFALPAEQQLAAFYQIWTGKEAFIKAIGRGLSFPLGSFSVECCPDRPRSMLAIEDAQFESTAWQMAAIDPAAEYAATVTWNGPAQQVTRLTFPSA